MPDKNTQAWLDKAMEDDEAVATLVDAGGPYAIAAFHVQQSGEKYIKAWLVAAGIPPPRTHDLGFLLSLNKQVELPTHVIGAAENLSVLAWTTRYPGGPEITSVAVEDAQRDLSVLREWVLDRIKVVDK